MKRCTKCEKIKNINEFHNDKNTKDGKRPSCKKCQTKVMRRHYQKNRKEKLEKVREYNKVNKFTQLLKRYGIDKETYEYFTQEQNGLCAICKELPHSVVDHDHQTGKVRGLLCRWCNWGLGNFKDSEKSLDSAIKYLGLNKC